MLESFYDELSQVLKNLVSDKFGELADFYGESSIHDVITESCHVNHWLLNVPGKDYDSSFDCKWNILDCYSSRIAGGFSKLEKETSSYRLVQSRSFADFREWLQNVVWYGNKRGDYLNGFKDIST